jgi:hypothetical protein
MIHRLSRRLHHLEILVLRVLRSRFPFLSRRKDGRSGEVFLTFTFPPRFIKENSKGQPALHPSSASSLLNILQTATFHPSIPSEFPPFGVLTFPSLIPFNLNKTRSETRSL